MCRGPAEYYTTPFHQKKNAKEKKKYRDDGKKTKEKNGDGCGALLGIDVLVQPRQAWGAGAPTRRRCGRRLGVSQGTMR